MTNHPLTDFLTFYYKCYAGFKQENPDLSNLDFHQKYGLYINGPVDWPYVDGIKELVDVASKGNIVIIYSSTDMYHKIYKGIGEDNRASYLSFADIFYAIHRDQDALRGIKNRLSNSELVICAGTLTAADEVLTQIRGFCDGCLVMLG
jgi:hypothetical protein